MDNGAKKCFQLMIFAMQPEIKASINDFTYITVNLFQIGRMCLGLVNLPIRLAQCRREKEMKFSTASYTL
jgi:hypothetical protein